MDKTLPASAFVNELESLINRHSYENGSNTPDFILAEYMLNCLASFNGAVSRREKWYGRNPRQGPAGMLTEKPTIENWMAGPLEPPT